MEYFLYLAETFQQQTLFIIIITPEIFVLKLSQNRKKNIQLLNSTYCLKNYQSKENHLGFNTVALTLLLFSAHIQNGKEKYLNQTFFSQNSLSTKFISNFKGITHKIQLT